eukprot:1687812-Prorocentrum_lima.AAC.1
MTSSLVGSEMCIRDRCIAHATRRRTAANSAPLGAHQAAQRLPRSRSTQPTVAGERRVSTQPE